MFLEKYHRFVRHYRFAFEPRKKKGFVLPLTDNHGEPSILQALRDGVATNKALSVRPNGDIIELMSVDVHKASGGIVGLLHRASPNAADPVYRRKAREGYDLRKATKDPGEQQSVSAHLIILPGAKKGNAYDAILEEIPGLSMSVVAPVITRSLQAYEYSYKDNRGQDQSTYTTFKPEGVKSETVSNALKTGNFGFITLSRPAEATFLDDEDVFEPVDQKMKLRVKGKVDSQKWMDLIGDLAKKARGDG